MNDTPITVQYHPPERRQRGRRPSSVIAPCCCCCCCCCLHTVGGVAFAALASRVESSLDVDTPMRSEEEYRALAPDLHRVGSEREAVRLYWRVFLLVLALSLGGILPFATGGDFAGYAILLLLAFPACQLAVSLLAFVIVQFASPAWIPDKQAAHARLGKLTGYMLLGVMAGTVFMCGLGGLLGMFR